MRKQIIFVLAIATLAISSCNSATSDRRSSDEPYFQYVNAASIPEPLPQNNQPTSTTTTSSPQSTINLPKVTPLEVVGNDINILSDSSMVTLNRRIYDQFVKQGFSGQINISAVNISDGVQLFCQEQSSGDVVAISRAMTVAEKEICRSQGRQLVELPIGYDALVIVVNRENTFVKDVTIEELAAIFLLEKWSDVNPSWPDENIRRFVSGPISSTLQQLADTAFAGQTDLILSAPNSVVQPYDEPLAQGLSVADYGVGFFVYDFYKNYTEELFTPLAINGTVVNERTVSSGAYPMPRKLFLYTDSNVMKTKPQVSNFINYYLTHVNKALRETAKFPLSQGEIDASKVTWLRIMGINTLPAQNPTEILEALEEASDDDDAAETLNPAETPEVVENETNGTENET